MGARFSCWGSTTAAIEGKSNDHPIHCREKSGEWGLGGLRGRMTQRVHFISMLEKKMENIHSNGKRRMHIWKIFISERGVWGSTSNNADVYILRHNFRESIFASKFHIFPDWSQIGQFSIQIYFSPIFPFLTLNFGKFLQFSAFISRVVLTVHPPPLSKFSIYYFP